MVKWDRINNADQSKCIKLGCIFITDMEHPYSRSLKFTTLAISYLFSNPNNWNFQVQKIQGLLSAKNGLKIFSKFSFFFSLFEPNILKILVL